MVFLHKLRAEKKDRMGNLYASNFTSNASVFSLQDSCFCTVHKNDTFKMTNNGSKLKEDIRVRNLHLEPNKT